ncbi:ParA family protein [Flammeovirga aprica]|uniref:ParA family protein n=1 Tax=Flammeovirga aprica JL-4 TaxID=694437 RepID=A0A7X9RXM5_9BACT|nr:ParA family protein [Flammeovirga aprica]NME70549.1 ParA family protein [Flammeovirga aprica JL-4]
MYNCIELKDNTMVNEKRIISFLKKNDFLKHSKLEQMAGLSQGLISAVLAGRKSFSDAHLEKLYAVLKNFGIDNILNSTVISVMNNKGGVAKTTTTLNLGTALARSGKKVLLIDLDPQGNLSQCLGIDEPVRELKSLLIEDAELGDVKLKIEDNLTLIPSSIKLDEVTIRMNQDRTIPNSVLRQKLAQEEEEFDYIFIDLPPNLSVLNYVALEASESVIIPVEPGKLAYNGLDGAKLVIDQINRMNSSNPLQILGVLIIKAAPNEKIYKGYVPAIRAEEVVFKTEIPVDAHLKQSIELTQNVFDYAPKSKAAKAYKDLAKEVMSLKKN